MAILSGDWDINKNWFNIFQSSNGDYYIQTFKEDKEGTIEPATAIRFVMSGSKLPSEVKLAVANLCRVMEKHNLQGHPLDSKGIC